MRRPLRGHTFVEMLVTVGLLAILATAIVPVAAASRKREKEIQLHEALREIRGALDMYHEICQRSAGGGRGGPSPAYIQIKIEDDPGLTCWPKDLDVLVEGVETSVPKYKLRFLRRIPRDPFNVTQDEFDQHGWVLRSSSQDPERNTGWDSVNVFDVRSGSESQALDFSYYKNW